MLSVILMILFIIVVICLSFVEKFKYNMTFDILQMVAVVVAIILCLVFIIGVVAYDTSSNLYEEHSAIEHTMMDFTEGDIENSPIISDILKFNVKVVTFQRQYQNPWFNFGISKKVMLVETIKSNDMKEYEGK